jgi:hypothetical protein
LGRKTGMDMGQNRRIDKKRGWRWFGEEDRDGVWEKTWRKEKKRELRGFGRKTGMNMNGRIENQR